MDSWDTSRCGLPARLAWNASRAAWSLAETSKDLREDAGKLLGKVKGDDSGGRQVGIPHGHCLLHICKHHIGCRKFVSSLYLVMQPLLLSCSKPLEHLHTGVAVD